MSFWKPAEASSSFLIDRSSLSASGESGEDVLINTTGGTGGKKRNVSASFLQQELSHERQQLPIFARRLEILCALEQYETLVLQGETGSGKSTQLVQYLVEANWTDGGRLSVCCTQPRRVAAMMLAARVAQEQGCPLGTRVGYQVRFDSLCHTQPGRPSDIVFATDGMLVQELLRDPLLSRYSVVIVDEAHERSLHTDLLLCLLKRVQAKRRPPCSPPTSAAAFNSASAGAAAGLSTLRLVIASATMDAAAFRDFFQSSPASSTSSSGGSSSSSSRGSVAVLSVDGRQHPLDIHYLQKPCRDYLQCCCDTVCAIFDPSSGQQRSGGDVLVFLPGKEEIVVLGRALAERLPGTLVLPLYAGLAKHAQLAVFAPSRGRRVILATNMAESSLTIPSVTHVVDCCLVRLPFSDHAGAGVSFLVTLPVSVQGARQRAGRAGRTQAGKVYRLCTQEWFQALPPCPVAEVQRCELSWTVLQLLALGITDLAHVDFVTPPSALALCAAIEVLFSLQAVDGAGAITCTGLCLARMGTNPRLGRALLESLRQGCAEEVLSVAAMLSIETPYAHNNNSSNSYNNSTSTSKDSTDDPTAELLDLSGDHLTLLNIFNTFNAFNAFSEGGAAWCAERGLSSQALARAGQIRASLRRALVSAAAVWDGGQGGRGGAGASASAGAGIGVAAAGAGGGSVWGGVGGREGKKRPREEEEEEEEERGAGMGLGEREGERQRQGQGRGSGSGGGGDSEGEWVLGSCGDDRQSVLVCIVSGYFAHAARLSPRGGYVSLSGGADANTGMGMGMGMTLHPTSVLARFPTGAEYVVYTESECAVGSGAAVTGATGGMGGMGMGGVGAMGMGGGLGGMSLSGRGVGHVVRMRGASRVSAAMLLRAAPHFYAAKR